MTLRHAGQLRPGGRGSGCGNPLTRPLEESISDPWPDHQSVVRAARESLFQQMSNKLSHELRNPLGALRVSSHLLRQTLRSSDPRLLATLDRIERSVLRCDRVLEELFDFTRDAAIELEPAVLDVWLARVLKERAPPSSMSVNLGLPGSRVLFDAARLRCAVVNVLENASEALGEGADDSPVCEPAIALHTGESNHRIEIVVEDNGPGIPADVLPRIFEPLYSTKAFGMGLGLPAARQVMELHGGGIEIETEEGRGTRVCLWLPTIETHRSKEMEKSRC